jgi:hypothetical protein
MAGTIMYDQKTGKRVSVNDKYVDQYTSKGYATTKPKSTTKNDIVYDPDSNQTKYYDKNGIQYKSSRGDKTDNATHDNSTTSTRGKTSSKTSSYYSDDISDQYDAQRKSLIAQLRASIAKAKGGYTDMINKAPQTYQPLRNQTELTKEQQLRSALERNAATGDRGGIGRQGLLDINTAAGNQMNDINLQQQNVINDANSAISSLDEQAAFKESEITADTASQKLQALLAENTRIDELNRDQERYSQEYSDRQKQQEFNNSNILADREAEQADKALRTEIETMGRYFSDFQAEINRRGNTADKSDDALIPYLQAARAEKIAKQLADADNSASQAYKNAYNMWLQLGVATPEVARILGIEAGAKTLDKVKAEYSTSKPYYNPNTGGGGDNSSGGGGSEVPWYLR